MRIKPVASDSMGVRSMATYVETDDCKIFIDPSAALGPKRYRLPPTKKEINALNFFKKEISDIVEKCDILTISHYHYDHYDPEADFYNGKKVFAKSIKSNINKSQKKRGQDFKESIKGCCDLVYADDTVHYFGETKIMFSPPFFHGPKGIRLGYVIMTVLDDGKQKLIHASDVQGPVTKEATDFIIKTNPDVLIMDGPPTYFLGWRFSNENLLDAEENLKDIIKDTGCDVILDHHLLRDLRYKERFSEPYKSSGEKIKTFAEYLGKKNNTLEAHRKELYKRQ